jgi:Pyruvate/2-oxoacid:ferredoxin oxidoreductase delta subunit
MKVMRKIIEIDEELCDGCGLCIPSCAEGALQVIDGKAKLVGDKYCDGLGACLGECPNDALKTVEREAEAFDEEAVEALLQSREKEKKADAPVLPCGCPSTLLQSFTPPPDPGVAQPVSRQSVPPALSHWPIQINLVPATASFLKGADLLIAADCTAFTYPDFHQTFLKGKVLLVGCPKFDDVKGYERKFAEIFSTADIRSVTIAVIEVPCCQGLPMIVKKAMDISGKKIPTQVVVITTRGNVLKKEELAA